MQTVTLGDEEARRRRTQKTILERKAPPTFDVLVEIQSWNGVAVHADVAKTVDAGAPWKDRYTGNAGAGRGRHSAQELPALLRRRRNSRSRHSSTARSGSAGMISIGSTVPTGSSPFSRRSRCPASLPDRPRASIPSASAVSGWQQSARRRRARREGGGQPQRCRRGPDNQGALPQAGQRARCRRGAGCARVRAAAKHSRTDRRLHRATQRDGR